jgi:hypothetical protein
LLAVFLSKPHSILTGNKVMDAAASNIDGFSWSDICVLSTQPNRPISINSHLHVETLKLQEVLPSKLNSILPKKQCAIAPASNTDGFRLRNTSVASTHLNRPIWKKQSPSPPWNT